MESQAEPIRFSESVSRGVAPSADISKVYPAFTEYGDGCCGDVAENMPGNLMRDAVHGSVGDPLHSASVSADNTLLAWWKFDDRVTPTFVAGKFGQGLFMDGTTFCVEVGNLGCFTSVTYAFWLKPESLTRDYNAIMNCNGWEGTAPHLQLLKDGRLLLSVKDASPFDMTAVTSLAGRMGRWVHVAVVVDGDNGKVRFYFDGKLDCEQSVALPGPLNLRGVRLGGWNDGTRFLHGTIDDARIYGNALSAEAVASISAGERVDEEPEAWWKLDGDLVDAMGQHDGRLTKNSDQNKRLKSVYESAGGGRDQVAGYYEFSEGVSGSALTFDGYTTEVVRKRDAAPRLGDTFTLSAWVAPQEYSWNLSAIINQQQDLHKGYFFGINHAGQLVGSLAVNSEWKTCISTESLPLLQWSHVTMVFDANTGIELFINGEKAGEVLFSGKPLYASDTEISIGKTQTKMTPALTERNTSKAVVSWMYFDGLIDEVMMYDTALAAGKIKKQFAETEITKIQPLQYRRLPSGTDETRPFGAYYTRLKYAPGWDARWRGSDLPDVIVRFDNSPVKLVFWRGTGYIPAMVTENDIWMSDQSGENWGGGECFEAMGDKQCRYSHVRIIENTPARVVVHWRYALASISHKIKYETEIYPGDWMDEYWTAYPDGVVVRKQVLWTETKMSQYYQLQETIFFNQPGTKPQDNVEYEAITFLDMDGNKASYSWEQGAPKSFPEPKYKPIEMVNTKSKYKPYSIHHPERYTRPFSFGWVKGYSNFPCWNHWPVSQIASDGRKAVAPDKASHSSLAAVDGDRQKYEKWNDGSIRVRSIMGMTTKPIASVLPLARSWNYPPKVNSSSAGYTYSGYDQYQRAYLFEKQEGAGGTFEFELLGSKASPIVNVPVVISNWGASVAEVVVNGIKADPADVALGAIRSLEGGDLVVWIKISASVPTRIIIKTIGEI